MVPAPNRICFDCAYPTAEERNMRWEHLLGALDRSQKSLRDKFAMAALPAVIEGGEAAKVAYVWADAMLEARKP